jgi:dolichol kinase
MNFVVGIGDSAASIVGSKHGKIKFPNSSKTAEGMAASIVAQVYLHG